MKYSTISLREEYIGLLILFKAFLKYKTGARKITWNDVIRKIFEEPNLIEDFKEELRKDLRGTIEFLTSNGFLSKEEKEFINSLISDFN